MWLQRQTGVSQGPGLPWHHTIMRFYQTKSKALDAAAQKNDITTVLQLQQVIGWDMCAALRNGLDTLLCWMYFCPYPITFFAHHDFFFVSSEASQSVLILFHPTVCPSICSTPNLCLTPLPTGFTHHHKQSESIFCSKYHTQAYWETTMWCFLEHFVTWYRKTFCIAMF